MTLKTIKVSEENYRWLSSFAGELQYHHGRPVSLDEALLAIRQSQGITALAGSWKMTGKEAQKIQREIRKSWQTWQIESV